MTWFYQSLEAVAPLEYPGCQNLFLRGFRFQISLAGASSAFGRISTRRRNKPLVPRVPLECRFDKIFVEALDSYYYYYSWFLNQGQSRMRVETGLKLSCVLMRSHRIWTCSRLTRVMIVDGNWRKLSWVTYYYYYFTIIIIIIIILHLVKCISQKCTEKCYRTTWSKTWSFEEGKVSRHIQQLRNTL